MGPRQQDRVSIIPSAHLIANMEDLFGIMRILAVLILGAKTTKATTQLGNTNRKWNREDNKHILHCYFNSNPTQRGYKKRMREIFKDSARFNTSQGLADRARMVLKEGWFSD